MVGRPIESPKPESLPIEKFWEKLNDFEREEKGTYVKLGPPYEVVIIQTIEGREVSYVHFTF